MEKESNLNMAFSFEKHVLPFKTKVIDPHLAKTEQARKIFNDPDYKWRDEGQKNAGKAQLESYEAWLKYYNVFYENLCLMCKQHEHILAKMGKLYQRWYDDVSNEGLQEAEMMKSQADILGEIFCEIYNELKVLNFNIKPPKALNMK